MLPTLRQGEEPLIAGADCARAAVPAVAPPAHCAPVSNTFSSVKWRCTAVRHSVSCKVTLVDTKYDCLPVVHHPALGVRGGGAPGLARVAVHGGALSDGQHGAGWRYYLLQGVCRQSAKAK